MLEGQEEHMPLYALHVHSVQYVVIEVNSFHHKGQKLSCYKHKEAVFQKLLRQTPVHPL